MTLSLAILPQPTSLQLVREVIPSASRHVALALVHVPGPVHTVEAEPYYRVSLNIGPSYSAQSADGEQASPAVFARHSLMVIPPGLTFTQHGTPAPANRRVRPGRLATFRLSRELVSDSAMTMGLGLRHARLDHQIVPTDEVLRLLSQALLADLKAGNPQGPLATEGIARALLCRLLQHQREQRSCVASSPLDKVKLHIDAHLSAALTLEQLADVAGMSLFHFCRVFREGLGVTPHQYILVLRMEQAKRLLWAQSGLSMLEIAMACGFASSSHFAAQFKRHTAETPLQWQKSH